MKITFSCNHLEAYIFIKSFYVIFIRKNFIEVANHSILHNTTGCIKTKLRLMYFVNKARKCLIYFSIKYEFLIKVFELSNEFINKVDLIKIRVNFWNLYEFLNNKREKKNVIYDRYYYTNNK